MNLIKPSRLIIISIISALVISFIVYYDRSRYKAGYNAAVVEMGLVKDKAVRDAVKAVKLDLDKVVQDHQEKLKQAEIHAQELLARPPEVRTVEIIKTIENLECNDFGPDFAELLNSTIPVTSE